MIPMIQAEVVSHGWMTQQELVNFVAVSESTPGPFAVNVSTYVGAEAGGFLGAICATLGVVLPSFLVILAVAKCFLRFRSSRLVSAAMDGLHPAVVGLISAAAISIGQTVFQVPAAQSVSAFMFTFRILLSLFLADRYSMGALGVWIAMVADWVFRCICFVWRYYSGKWQKHKIAPAEPAAADDGGNRS